MGTSPFGALLRLLVIGCTVLSHGVWIALRFLGRWIVSSKQSGTEIVGNTLAHCIEALGPTFIKVGQLLSTRRDLLPLELLAPLRRLQDQVRPFDSALVPEIIRTSLGQPIEALFSEFDLVPRSSASIAQVHVARLRESGLVVALKIRRPGIDRIVDMDLRLLGVAARLLARLRWFHVTPVEQAISQVAEGIWQQLDFRKEAETNRILRGWFADHPHVRIPALIEELCTDNVITMEYISDLVRIDDPDLDLDRFRRVIVLGLRALYDMLFRIGRVHCDLHAGNMFACGKNSVAIMDTGFVAELSQEEVNIWRKFFLGIVLNDGAECARILCDTAVSWRAGFKPGAFVEDVSDLVRQTVGRSAGEFSVAGFVYTLFDLQRRHGVCGSPKFTLAIISLLVFEGVAKSRYPELDFQAEAMPYLGPSILQAARM